MQQDQYHVFPNFPNVPSTPATRLTYQNTPGVTTSDYQQLQAALVQGNAFHPASPRPYNPLPKVANISGTKTFVPSYMTTPPMDSGEPTQDYHEDQVPASNKRLKTRNATPGSVIDGHYEQCVAQDNAYVLAMLNRVSHIPVPSALPQTGTKRKSNQMSHQIPSVSAPPVARSKKTPQTRLPNGNCSIKLDQARTYGAFPTNATSLVNARALCQGRQYMRWQPSDQSVPKSDEGIQACAKRLFDAIVDLSDVELPLPRTRNGNRLILTMDYDEAYIAWRCFEIVDYAIGLHRVGCILPAFADRAYDVNSGKEILDKHLDTPRSYRELTFAERMDDMVSALQSNKIIAQDVLDAQLDLGYALVLAPYEALKTKGTNAKQNGQRARQTEAQRQRNANLTAQADLLQHQILANAPQDPMQYPSSVVVGKMYQDSYGSQVLAVESDQLGAGAQLNLNVQSPKMPQKQGPKPQKRKADTAKARAGGLARIRKEVVQSQDRVPKTAPVRYARRQSPAANYTQFLHGEAESAFPNELDFNTEWEIDDIANNHINVQGGDYFRDPDAAPAPQQLNHFAPSPIHTRSLNDVFGAEEQYRSSEREVAEALVQLSKDELDAVPSFPLTEEELAQENPGTEFQIYFNYFKDLDDKY